MNDNLMNKNLKILIINSDVINRFDNYLYNFLI